MTAPNDREPGDQPARMRPTRPPTLVVAALTTAGLAWVTVHNFYGTMPDLPWLPPLTMFVLAAGEGYAARVVKGSIERRKGFTPLDPLVIARYVVLAKASAMAAALFGGFYAGLTGWLIAQRDVLGHAAADLPAGFAGTAGCVALVAAALLLERACQVPGGTGGDEPGGSSGDGRGVADSPGGNGRI